MEMMDILRDCGADPLLTDSQGYDALFYIIQQRCPTDVVRHMLQILKDDPDWSPATASPVIYEAVCCRSPNLESIRLLLEAGISPESENRDGKTLLHAAVSMQDSTDVLELLLDFGADPNNGGKCGLPPILRTLDYCSHEKFHFFLRNGADPNATNAKGKTVLQVVIEEASPRAFRGLLVESLLECDSLVVFDIETQTSPAFLAAVSQPNFAGWDEKILDLLLEKIPTYGRQRMLNSALQIASGRNYRGHCDTFTVFYLLRVGADPVSVANGSDTLLHRICAAQRLEDHEHRDDMRNLLSRQVLDINASGNDGKVPLHHAVKMGNRDLVYLLLEHKADPNVKDVEGQTPLQLLCSTKVEEFTISHSQSDVQVDADDAQYRGVRGHASWKFVTRERRWNIKRGLEQEEMFQVLLEHGADITVADNQGRTLLMMASEQGNSVIAANILYSLGIKWLAGIDDEAECPGLPILPFSHSNGLQGPGMKLLADAINVTDCSGKTALHFAAATGDLCTLKTLLNPQQIFRPTPNLWRALAEDGESHEDKKMNTSLESPTEKRMIEQEIEYQRSLSVPSFLRKDFIYMDEPKEVKLTIGGPRRREVKNIYFPNVSVSEWKLDTDEGETLVRLEEQVDCKGRTPLHYAADSGHLEAVKLLLKYDCIDVQARDHSGRRAIDLALDNNFYDVFNALQN
jgi:ankyrin repeat protein